MTGDEFIRDILNDLERKTALDVLKDILKYARPNTDLFGNKTLVIDRDKFEMIRSKYLDKKG